MSKRDHPGIVAPPPLLYLIAVAIVAVLHWFWPLPIVDHEATAWAGAVVLALGLAFNLWGARSMIRARTPINPYKPVEGIVASGAFRVSRNPLYVGLYLVFLGLVLVINSLWGLILFVPLFIVMHYGVILREERYLEARFGEDYRRYRSSVRRYI